jgi:glutamate---cysteine ligase / carboxylate-amine ligase
MREDSLEPAERPLGLFEAYGVELEYMIVDAETLDVVPAADELLAAAAGELTDEHVNGDVAWNNELALHVIELKCNGPRRELAGLAEAFQANVAEANRLLESHGARLMPSAMHPWMNPADVRLWPHGSSDIYRAFDRIFGCRGHGWANLQSAHLNLPFAGNEEFARLHAAVRFLLPILPGLAASSPVVNAMPNGVLDNRLAAYRGNCARIPSITGEVVPEPIYDMDEYRERLLGQLYADLAPHDPDGVLRHEWVNARGAIVRFERMAIEIRVLDVQECPGADVAYARVIAAAAKALCEERWCTLAALRSWDTRELAALLAAVERDAERTTLGNGRYTAALGFRDGSAALVRLWEHMADAAAADGALDAESGRFLEHYLRQGSLATRIRRAVGPFPARATLSSVYRELCDALASGTSYSVPGPG